MTKNGVGEVVEVGSPAEQLIELFKRAKEEAEAAAPARRSRWQKKRM